MYYKEGHLKRFSNWTEALKALSDHLNDGNLGLILGAGASAEFKLPMWKELVDRCIDASKTEIDYQVTESEDFESIMGEVKSNLRFDDSKYKTIVQDQLYLDYDLEFDEIDKNLLIALTALISGTKRRSVDTVINFNFDSLLEWYLQVNGIDVSTTFSDGKIIQNSDVEIVHPHGYLPHPQVSQKISEVIRFSWDEIINFKMDENNYLRQRLINFFKSKIFLSVGISPKTLNEYFKDFISHILTKKVARNNLPFGFAIIPEGELSDYDPNVRKKLIKYGIICIEMPIPRIPEFLFSISQKAAGFEVPFKLKK